MSNPDDWDLAFATVPRPIYLLVQRLAELEKRLQALEDAIGPAVAGFRTVQTADGPRLATARAHPNDW